MMKLPWRRERRDVTDTVIEKILDAAQAQTINVAASGAITACAELYADAFASAEVDPPLITRRMLSLAVRSWLECGAAVLFRAGNGVLLPVGRWTVTGSAGAWRYEVTVGSPTGDDRTMNVDPERVLHFIRAPLPERPWAGRTPGEIAKATGTMLGHLERVLGDELSAQVGGLLPIPVDPADETVTQFRADLGNIKGKTLLVEATATEWDRQGRQLGAQYDPKRIGPDPPNSLGLLHQAVTKLMVAACGVPVGLVTGEGQQRELWRRFQHGAVQPLGRLIAEEMTEKFGRTVTLDFADLFAADVQGRARAYNSLVGAGMPGPDAARLAGLQDE